jgi:transcriptional regulator with XRE-family HTH domain
MGGFKSVFKYLRIRDGLNQNELAIKLGISRSAVSMYESGKREPDINALEKIADFFNVDMNYLTGTKKESGEYYTDLQTRQIAQEIFENKELKLLFDASRNAKPEDLDIVRNLLLQLKNK